MKRTKPSRSTPSTTLNSCYLSSSIYLREGRKMLHGHGLRMHKGAVTIDMFESIFSKKLQLASLIVT